jgi:hypothetical protein
MSNEELIAFVKKNPIGIVCGVLSLALFGGWYYRSGDVPEKEADLAQKQAEGERYALNLTAGLQLKEQFESLAAANKEIEHRLVRASQIGPNYQFFYKLESETGVKLTDPRQSPLAAPRKDAAKAAYTPVAFNVVLSGDFTQVLNFLRRLESGAHYCRVLSATCSVASERSQPLNVNLTLELLGVP